VTSDAVSDTGDRGAGAVPATAVTLAVAQAARARQRLRFIGVLAGVTGPVLLAAYFTTPAVAGWPYAGTSPGKLIAYASAHRLLFYGGGWLLHPQ
jgi:hypothetical protein